MSFPLDCFIDLCNSRRTLRVHIPAHGGGAFWVAAVTGDLRVRYARWQGVSGASVRHDASTCGQAQPLLMPAQGSSTANL